MKLTAKHLKALTKLLRSGAEIHLYSRGDHFSVARLSRQGQHSVLGSIYFLDGDLRFELVRHVDISMEELARLVREALEEADASG